MQFLWLRNCSRVRVDFSKGLLAIRNSSRSFVRAPALSLALLFTIALGVGSNASIYGFVDGLTHPEFPLRGRGSIVSILQRDRVRESGPLSLREYQVLKNATETFDWIDAARIAPAEITLGDRTEIAIVATVGPDLAHALGLPVQNGAVLSHRLAQRELAESPDLAQKRIRVNGLDLPIAAVAPDPLRGLYSDQPVDLWIPATDKNPQSKNSAAKDLWVLGQIRQPASIRQAQAAVRRQLGNSDEFSVAPFTGVTPATALALSHIGILLNLAAAAVFIVASLNVASFLFGRALKRSHETSLRIALGATRTVLLRGLLSDSIVISVAGGALGVLLAVGTVHVLPALLFAEDAEHLVFAPHLFPIVAASLLCVCLSILCGMMPVFATDTDRPWGVLGREAGLPSKRTERIRTAMVLSQITACYVLVICAVFLFQGLHAALKASVGRHLSRPILLTVQERLTQPVVEVDFFNAVERAAKSIAGQAPQAWAARLPGDRPVWESFRIQPASSPLRDLPLDINWVAPEGLQSLSERLVAGRVFRFRDPARTDIVLDEDAANQLFGLETVGITILDPAGQPAEVIGVVKSNPAPPSKAGLGTANYLTENLKGSNPILAAHFRAPLLLSLPGAELNANVVSPGYLNALDLPLVSGLGFPQHSMAGRTRIGIVNQEAADLYFGEKPLGSGVIDEQGVRTEIVGVVGSRALGRFQQHAEPAIYFPMQQDCAQRMTLLLESSRGDTSTLAALRSRVEAVPGRNSAPVAIETLDAHLARTAFAPMRIAALLSGALAVLALGLGVLGLFSAQSDAERQRRRELALCIALGAQRWRIVLKVMARALQIALAGTVIGALAALVLFRILAGTTALFTSLPPWMWLTVALLPVTTVFIASLLPAIRASHVNPLTIMRDEH